MDSREINHRLRALDRDEEFTQALPAHKIIPYIGWFWREVNFDRLAYSIGVIPKDSADDIDENYAGFMEANKWGYPYIYMTTTQTTKLHELIVGAILEETTEAFIKVHKWMQKLGKGKEYHVDKTFTPRHG